jgi:hypothetical protein
MSNSALTAASKPIRLSGTVYNVSPLDDKDTSELDEYVRFIHMETAKAAAITCSDESIKHMIISSAVAQASSLSFMSPQGAAIIKSVDGVSRILWHGIKHNHPEVTHEFIRSQLFSNKSNIAEANKLFDELNVKPLQGVAARGKVLAAALRKKTSTSNSRKGTTSRPKKSRR